MRDATDKYGWCKIFTALVEADVEFLVVGGAALVLHGIPRTTLDVDIYIPSDEAAIHHLARVLCDALCLTLPEDSPLNAGLDAPFLVGQWLTFCAPDGPDLVDVFVTRAGEYNALLEEAEVVDIAGVEVSVAGLELLKRMKRECGRPIDLADLVLIEEFEALRNDDF